MRPVTFYGVFGRRNAIPIVCNELALGLLSFRDLRIQPIDHDYHCGTRPELEYFFADKVNPESIAIIHGFPGQAFPLTNRHAICVGGFVADGSPVGTLQAYSAGEQTKAIYLPSTWSKAAYEASGYTKPTAIVPHGVAPEYIPRKKHTRGAVLNLGMNCYSASVWHRKALPETLRAMKYLKHKARLTLKVGAPNVSAAFTILAAEGIDPSDVSLDTTDDMLYFDLCTWMHRFDAILQPSRCEGAGMVGKECLAAGVPFVGTFDTGHADYLPAPGAVQVPTIGRVRAKAYAVGMEAGYPDVRFDDIMRAVEQLDNTYEEVEAAARENATEFAKAHSWKTMAEKLHHFLLQVAP